MQSRSGGGILMKNKTQSSPTVAAPFEGGQVWQLEHSHVQIELVGRTLVHYRHYTGMAKRPPILLSSKLALEKFLKRQRATVIEAAAIRPPTAHDRVDTWRKTGSPAPVERKRGAA
jgi:hypothetical protein